ncbi:MULTISPECIES: alpha/beta fold hydrolase [Streptomyces]|uniref:Alpha/beta hydrolase n=1 Tax=Streptomyces lycii TaxID=2654337 RepID=A0ABQ7FJI6_9ACTN|nr:MULTISPECIES: alpha/beta hydrolase [Streptomyces]KAF4407392.1 alpha/beta hydrolase [Streptomyces lycii]PGH49884.1 alpha/beta hydrolase [Streptomyces sp. Ru87]
MTQQTPQTPSVGGPRPAAEDLPRAATHAFTSFDGTVIRYHVYEAEPAGTEPAGPPVVLHHGFVADTFTNWSAPGIVGALTARGHRVVGIDARGHGRSGKPHDSARYGEPAMARDLSALLDELGAEHVRLAGYSMGAVVSLLAAAADDRITRLVAGGVGAGIVEMGGLDTRAVPPEGIVAALTAEDPSAVGPEAAGFRALADAVGADRAALAAHAAAVHQGTMPLADVRVPVLVLAGDEDPLAVRPSVLVDALPDARLLTVPGDHVAAVGDPGFAAAIVDFFSEN